MILLFTVFSYSYSYAQNFDTQPQDSLYEQKLAAFRQTIWDSLSKPQSWITDYENLFTDTEKSKLDSIINEFEKETAIEIAIITVDTMFVSKQKFEDFAFHIANMWGIGKKEVNNGILIAISREYRQMRIVNGYGIEKLITDNETKLIIDDYFIPDFKNGEYFKGTISGLSELTGVLKTKLK